MTDLSQHVAVQRVAQTLAAFGVRGQVRVLDDAVRTAQAAADALGVEVGQIANSLVFVAIPVGADPEQGRHELGEPAEPLLILTSGAHRVDTHKVADVIGLADLAQATPEVVREATGFAIGGGAPPAPATQNPPLVGGALSPCDGVWGPPGRPPSGVPPDHQGTV